MDLLSQPWAAWALGVAIGLPLLMVLLSELTIRLDSLRSPFSRPLQVVRVAVVPLGAVLLLLTRAAEAADSNIVRVLETCLTIAVVVAVLLLIDAIMASLIARESSRPRVPGIFVDLVRVLLVIAGVFIVLATVWTYPVEHFLTAIGVTSIVIGIALQNAVGNVISGLLLLSERPFSIGDWIQVGALTGRVSQINWRAVHLDTGASIQVVPNGMLATSTFSNFNRPVAEYAVATTLHFAIGDPPDRIRALLNAVAADLPELLPGTSPATELTVVDGTGCSYETTFMVASYASSKTARTSFLERAWFAARRSGRTLAGMPPRNELDEATAALQAVAALLRLDDADIATLAPQVRVEQWAPGETLQRQGEMAAGLRIILEGSARRDAERGRGETTNGELHRHDAFGGTAMTREPALATVVALDNLKVLTIPSDTLDYLLDNKPLLANDLGQMMDRLRLILSGTTPNTAHERVAGNGAASALPRR